MGNELERMIGILGYESVVKG